MKDLDYRSPGWESTDDESEELQDEKEKITRRQIFHNEFLSRWLNRDAEQSPGELAEDGEEDDDDDNLSPIGRFRRFFKRSKLLRRTVETRQTNTKGDELRGARSEAEVSLSQNTGKEQKELPLEQDYKGVLKIEHEDTDSQSSEAVEEDRLAPENAGSKTPEQPLTPEDNKAKAEVPPPFPPPIYEVVDLSPKSPQETAPTKTPEVRTEHHGGAIAAFLAAEFLSRRRDRKIKRQLKKLENEFVETAKKSRAETTETRNSVESFAKNSSSKESAPRKVTAEQAELPDIVVGKIHGKAEKPKLEEYREEGGNKSTWRIVEEKDPEKIVNMSEFSIDQNPESNGEVLESSFDRRHEVMDEAYVSESSGPKRSSKSTPDEGSSRPVLISQILSSREEQPVTQAPASNSESANFDSAEMYRRSVQNGVYAGLAIVVLGAIAYFVQ